MLGILVFKSSIGILETAKTSIIPKLLDSAESLFTVCIWIGEYIKGPKTTIAYILGPFDRDPNSPGRSPSKVAGNLMYLCERLDWLLEDKVRILTTKEYTVQEAYLLKTGTCQKRPFVSLLKSIFYSIYIHLKRRQKHSRLNKPGIGIWGLSWRLMKSHISWIVTKTQSPDRRREGRPRKLCLTTL